MTTLPDVVTAAAADAQRHAHVDCAYRAAFRVLPIFEVAVPRDRKHRAALAAVRRWLDVGARPPLDLLDTLDGAPDGTRHSPRAKAHVAIREALLAAYSGYDRHDDSCLDRTRRALEYARHAAADLNAEIAAQRKDLAATAQKWLAPWARVAEPCARPKDGPTLPHHPGSE